MTQERDEAERGAFYLLLAMAVSWIVTLVSGIAGSWTGIAAGALCMLTAGAILCAWLFGDGKIENESLRDNQDPM